MKLRSGNITDISKSLAQIQTTSRPPYLPPELWAMVGAEIPSQESLQALVLVCHAFRDVFKPILHSYRLIELSYHKVTDFCDEMLRPTMIHTRAFEVYLSEWQCNRLKYTAKWNSAYVSFLLRMLERMPNLQSFRWLDESYDFGFNPSLMIQSERLLAALKQCDKLQHVSIQLSDNFLDEESSDKLNRLTCWISLRGFRNLKSLELYNIWAPNNRLPEMCLDIAHVLNDNPQLRKLGLAVSVQVDFDQYPEAVIMQDTKFLETLCRCYGTKFASTPLTLETLRLGHKTFSYDHGLLSSTSFLEQLVDVEALKRLHLFNGIVTDFYAGENMEEPLELDWLGMKNCNSLRHVSLSRLHSDARCWLNDVGQSIEELVITDHFSMYDSSLNNFGALRLPNLSMLFTREITVKRRFDDDGSDIDEGFWTDESSESEHSQAPHMQIDRSLITVLDRLPDGGRKLTRLGMCFDFSTQWEIFRTHLPGLTKLTHLRLNGRSHKGGPYPPEDASLWDDAQDPQMIASRFARLMKSKCPSLQYIQIGNYSWEIAAPDVLDLKVDIDYQIKLRLLHQREVDDIELFALENFSDQGGLPGTRPLEKRLTTTHYGHV